MENQNSLLKIEAQAANLATRLTEYATKHSQEEQLEKLSVTISFISTILGSLSATLDRYASTLQLKREVLTQLEKSCAKDFDYIEKMLDQAAENNRDSVLLPYVGNYEAYKHLCRDVGDLKDHVWVVLDGFTYLAMKKLEKTQTLKPEQALDIKRHVDQLPIMQRMLERVESKIKTPLNVEASNPIRPRELVVYETEPVDRIKSIPRIIEDDARSIISISSITSDRYLDTPEIYECYTLKKEPANRNASQKTWRFLGLRVTEDFQSPIYYNINPQARTQSQLSEQLENLDIDKAPQTSYVARTISQLPLRAREEVEFLLEDRERATSNVNSRSERNWSVVDIENTCVEVQPRKGKLGFLRAKKREETEWMIILRGQTVKSEGEKMQKPDRFADPWWKGTGNVSRRCRSPPRGRPIFDPIFPAPPLPAPVRREKFRGPMIVDQKKILEETEKKIELILVEGAGNL